MPKMVYNMILKCMYATVNFLYVWCQKSSTDFEDIQPGCLHAFGCEASHFGVLDLNLVFTVTSSLLPRTYIF